SLILPGLLPGQTTLTYTGNKNGNYQVTVTLKTSLTGSELQNLPADTNIAGSILSFSMSDGVGPPAEDEFGYPSADFSLTAPAGAQPLPANVVDIGTSADGAITSWNISEA